MKNQYFFQRQKNMRPSNEEQTQKKSNSMPAVSALLQKKEEVGKIINGPVVQLQDIVEEINDGEYFVLTDGDRDHIWERHAYSADDEGQGRFTQNFLPDRLSIDDIAKAVFMSSEEDAGVVDFDYGYAIGTGVNEHDQPVSYREVRLFYEVGENDDHNSYYTITTMFPRRIYVVPAPAPVVLAPAAVNNAGDGNADEAQAVDETP